MTVRDPRAPRDPREPVADPRAARGEIIGRAKRQVGAAGKLFLEAVFGTTARTTEIVAELASEVGERAGEARQAAGKKPIEWNFGDEPAIDPDVIDVEGVEVPAAPARLSSPGASAGDGDERASADRDGSPRQLPPRRGPAR